MIAEPYRLRLVARDQVNQAAAVLLTTVGVARELGVPDDKRVFVHGYAALAERELMERQDLGVSPAARLAAHSALSRAGVSVDDIGYFDFYSCFPIAVFNVAQDAFGLRADDPRRLTVTGGLPYFGGPGNNYSMHAIASLMEKLRADPESYGFIGANGGFLSKYAAAVYSTRPTPWHERDSAQLQREIDAMAAPVLLEQADGDGLYRDLHRDLRVGTASERRHCRAPHQRRATIHRAFGCGRSEHLASHGRERSATRTGARALDGEGQSIRVATEWTMSTYQYSIVERRDHVLEVTINRPEVRNAVHPNVQNEEIARPSSMPIWQIRICGWRF